MKLYKICIIAIFIIGGIFIGQSPKAKQLCNNGLYMMSGVEAYKENPSNIKSINKKEEIKKYLICIDPGHQSKGNPNGEPVAPGSPYQKAKVSSGTVGISTKKPEYILNLDASINLKHILIDKGFDVIMTRETNDVDISNSQRAILANDNRANMVVRIHADSSDNTSITGASILVPSQNGKYTSSIFEPSYKCANLIKNKMDTDGFKVNGIFERDDLTGFNWSQVPVVLVEMGFMSNYNEDEMMSNKDYQTKMMQSIADGIEEYFETK